MTIHRFNRLLRMTAKVPVTKVMTKGLYERIRQWRQRQYTLVTDADCESSVPDEELVYERSSLLTCLYLFLSIGSLSMIGVLVQILSSYEAPMPQFPPCEHPSMRQEWRTLGPNEKADFVKAITCLSNKPSRMINDSTIYDDFAALHGGIGSWCHRSASFLPWHRYTLHIWEKALSDHCGFEGQIPYWDWSLDWMNLANSSIWDASTGFGGDGDPNGNSTVGLGRCVIDGPFTELRPVRYNHTYISHCLSRGFRDGNETGRLPSTPFSPDSIGRLLLKQTYQEFVREVEYSVHNIMHQSIAGDFLALTAANDPIFFLHHAQLDRLWWKWQQQAPRKRQYEYQGKHMFNSTGNATILDTLMVGGFADDIPVAHIMDTEGGLLCYRY